MPSVPSSPAIRFDATAQAKEASQKTFYQICVTTELRSIDQSGIIELSNGYQVAHPSRVSKWSVGAKITSTKNGPSRPWKFMLTNEENGQQVAASHYPRK
jgi:hypothetical protein